MSDKEDQYYEAVHDDNGNDKNKKSDKSSKDNSTADKCEDDDKNDKKSNKTGFSQQSGADQLSDIKHLNLNEPEKVFVVNCLLLNY